MKSVLAKWKWLAAVLALMAAVWCCRQWQSERQVQLHQRHLLEAAQNRDFKALKALLDDSFRASGGQDKTAALQEMAEGLRYFFSLEITASETQTSLAHAEANITARLHLEGRGLAAADAIQSLVNSSKDPFQFTWRRQSWKPWDWRLVSAGHPYITSAATGDWTF